SQHQIDRIVLELLRELPSSHRTPLRLVVSLPFEVSRIIGPLHTYFSLPPQRKVGKRKRLTPPALILA
ncbi:hypothetical protein, partial [Paraburkholderia caribensis]|uniref:hypothetical protein n=1 Tax=Paraburkholderia caribensis TaxID=75105 RepID=UPI001ABA2A65